MAVHCVKMFLFSLIRLLADRGKSLTLLQLVDVGPQDLIFPSNVEFNKHTYIGLPIKQAYLFYR